MFRVDSFIDRRLLFALIQSVTILLAFKLQLRCTVLSLTSCTVYQNQSAESTGSCSVLSTDVYQVECHKQCKDFGVCPEDKPYCTDAGCVFECPEPLYINETVCVSNCGDMFVDNQLCEDACPENWFVREIPKLVSSHVYIEKQCTQYCDSKEYVYGNECVKTCPLKYNFISQGVCSTQCPDKEHLLWNFSINSLVYHKCELSCPTYVEDIYCTDICSAAKPFVFNSTCVDTCPATNPLSSEKRCVQHCPLTSVPIENVCLKNCTEERPYYRNMTCTDTCPKAFYITHRSGVIYCEEKCRQREYTYKNTCLTSCDWPLFYLNDTCQDNCHENYFKSGRNCVSTCAANEYIYNRTCVSNCPENTYLNNTMCLNKCPSQHPFYCQLEMGPECSERKVVLYVNVNNQPNKVCVSRCPDHSFIYNNSCVKVCPANFLVSEQRCLPVCSKEVPLIQNKTLTFDKWTYSNYYIYPWRKRTQSKQVRECVSRCRVNMVAFNSTCTSKCPESYPYIMNGTCISEGCGTMYMLNDSTGISCVDDCSKYGFVYENTCSKICPDYVSNNTCVQACPHDSPFHQPVYSGIRIVNEKVTNEMKFKKCVGKCSDPYNFLDKVNKACVDICPKERRFIFLNVCTEACPKGKVLNEIKPGIDCAKACTRPKLLFNKTCVSSCPKQTFNFNGSECVFQCPKAKSLGLKEDNWRCIERCDSIKVFKDGKCIYESDCSKPYFVFNYSCVMTCPDGYLYISPGCEGRWQKVNVIEFVALIGSFTLLLGSLRICLKEYFIVISMIIFKTDESSVKQTDEEEMNNQEEQPLLRQDLDESEIINLV